MIEMTSEQLRLQQLHSYQILDSEAEPAFDEITTLLARVCQAPIALISLVDSDRQWFKSRVGLSFDQTPLEDSFCRLTVAQKEKELVVYPDLRSIGPFQSHPLVVGRPHYRFYAGVALMTPQGAALGTLCVLDFQPRQLDEDQKAVMETLARQVMTLLELRRARLELEAGNRTLQAEIDERRRLEEERERTGEQLRQTQKMESIGRLAAGVAHDFNNILTIQQGIASVLLLEPALTDDIREPLQQLLESSQRGAALTRQLLVFSRKQPMQLSSVRLNDVVTNLMSMLGRMLSAEISLRINLEPALPALEGDQGMLEQIVTNLVVNARDAMPRGGLLRLSTQSVLLSAEDVAGQLEARAGHFVALEVSDSGTGIAPGMLPHLFEPFFTTKDVGQGTGLGLATVYGIVQQHRGWLQVQTEPGQGTTFRAYFPARPVEAKSASEVHPGKPVPSAEQTILLVEDEKPLREAVKRLLARFGYRVLTADSGGQAWSIWQQHREEIDLVFTDMVMPGGMNGRQLADRLWQEQPDLKVLFTSGYHPDNYAPADSSNFLQKPYEARQLAEKVQELLGA